jgi:hypothetical protein
LTIDTERLDSSPRRSFFVVSTTRLLAPISLLDLKRCGTVT